MITGRFGELLLILAIVLLLFGANKIPALMHSLGKGLRSFKKGLHDEDHNSDD